MAFMQNTTEVKSFFIFANVFILNEIIICQHKLNSIREMKMKKNKISGIPFIKILMMTIMLFTGLSSSIIAQETEEFKPGGKMEARIFTSLGTTFSGGENHTKFDLGRAYLGYNYNFSRKLTGRLVYDVSDPSVGKLKFTGMLKFAYLKYQTGKLTVSGGMIALPEYDFGDRKWGFRYTYKTLHDEYGFGTAADLGLNVTYSFASWISADLTVMNGEGFKLTESDSTFKAAASINVMPFRNFSLRMYFDNMSKNSVNQETTEIIAAYENRGYVISAAWNYRWNHNLIKGQDYQGVTVNGTIPVRKKIRIFGRYDYLASVKTGSSPDPWNLAKDGQLFMTGVDFSLAPGVSLSPNFTGWKPADSSRPFISRFTISLDLKI